MFRIDWNGKPGSGEYQILVKLQVVCICLGADLSKKIEIVIVWMGRLELLRATGSYWLGYDLVGNAANS